MRDAFLAMSIAASIGCGHASNTFDANTADGAADSGLADVAVDSVAQDTGAVDGTHGACPTSCSVDQECAVACPGPAVGMWCCVAGACTMQEVCALPADAGRSDSGGGDARAADCTGAGQCDTMHPCGFHRVCCPALTGAGCGFCSGDICP
jgi:hypothetical protein